MFADRLDSGIGCRAEGKKICNLSLCFHLIDSFAGSTWSSVSEYDGTKLCDCAEKRVVFRLDVKDKTQQQINILHNTVFYNPAHRLS
jgi:hypothetical protein